MRYRPKHLVEYAALKFVAAVINALPYRLALGFGGGVAAVTYPCIRARVAEAESRVRRVFGDRFPEREVHRIAWISWRNLVLNVVEVLRFPRMTLPWIQRVCDFASDLRTLQEHAATGAGAIVAVPHMGNWDMAAVSCRLHGLRMFSIAAQQKNPLSDAFLTRLRSSQGVDTISRGSGTMREVIRRLKDGQMLAILPDVRMRQADLSLSFLGGVANLGSGMGAFARQTNVPIFPFVVRRVGRSHQRVTALPVVRPNPADDKRQDIKRMTASVIQGVEAAIRETPEQWFWFNRRWILDPVEAGAAAVRGAPPVEIGA